MNIVNQYFIHSELAMAGYSTLSRDMTLSEYIESLKNNNNGMSTTQAEKFTEQWQVIAQSDSITGASATLTLWIFWILIFVCMLTFSGCDMNSNVWEPCEPLPVVDGYRKIKLEKSNMILKLPEYADMRRRHSEYEGEGCEYLRSLSATYLWYKGKLIPEGINRFKVPLDKRIKVFFRFTGSGDIKDWLEHNLKLHKKRPWRFDSPLVHKHFPLEYYPKYYWDDPASPSEKSLKAASLDTMWGVRNTKYKTFFDNRAFIGFCPIPIKDKIDPGSRIESDLTKNGAAACQISIIIAHGEQYISGWVRVYANQGSKQAGIMEINHIVDAMVEELQSFIAE